jgi:hypothetical protein
MKCEQEHHIIVVMRFMFVVAHYITLTADLRRTVTVALRV